MPDVAQIKRLIREIVGANPNLPVTAIVKSVEDDSCTVELKSGLIISDVKLKATINDSDNFLLMTPKIGTSVVMISLSGDMNNLTVVKMNQAEKVEYNQDGLNVLIDSSDWKVQIKNDEVSLHELLTDLTTLLKQLKVFTPSGPSGTPLPDTITALEDFETGFNKLIK